MRLSLSSSHATAAGSGRSWAIGRAAMIRRRYKEPIEPSVLQEMLSKTLMSPMPGSVFNPECMHV
jgi:hypothetical protein